jgi:hypothetical protein
METTGTHIDISDRKIELEGATLLHLNEIRKWTLFLSILGFVAVGLLFFVSFILFMASSFLASSLGSSLPAEQLGLMGPVLGVVYILVAVIYFFPVFYLYKFSVNTKNSLLQIRNGGPSGEHMAQAIGYLKKHFRFIGIMTILMMAIYVLVIIGMAIAVALR